MRDIAVVVLLSVGMGIQALCAIGVLVMDDPFDRLHFTGPAGLGVLAVAAAILVKEGLSVAGVKSLLVAVLIIVSSPVLTHATARAARIRQFGHWVAMPAEKVGD